MTAISHAAPQAATAAGWPRVWLAFLLFSIAIFALGLRHTWLVAFPEQWIIPFSDAINPVMDQAISIFRPLTRAIAAFFELTLNALARLLANTPWMITSAVILIVAYLSGRLPVLFGTAVAILYIRTFDYWDESMNSLAIVTLSVSLSIASGFYLGILGFKSPAVARFLEPTLDVMQTVPTLTYLVPILLLFGFGPVAGMLSGAIFAMPPMARNTMLGLRRVSPSSIEAAKMAGATPRQLLWQVRIPSSRPQIMLGVNQTILAAFGMIIVASVIGGFKDIGWEVLTTMRKAAFGESLIAGGVIVAMAMVFDRITNGFTSKRRGSALAVFGPAQGSRTVVLLLSLALVMAALVAVERTEAFAVRNAVAAAINGALDSFVTGYSWYIDSAKNLFLSYFMLPLKSGWMNTVGLAYWGFTFSSEAALVFVAAAAAPVMLVYGRFGWRWAGWLGTFFVVYFFGLVNIPWPVFIGAVTLIGYQIGGTRIALLALVAMLFLLTGGVWRPAMVSIYLVATSVMVCFCAGGLLGIWASESDGVSAIIRPINDMVQTIPLFVFLIPALMVFKIGEFTAILAIVAYAIVPMIRYTEVALRKVPKEISEVGRMMGASKLQLLYRVKLPVAMPEILLGFNQTVMYAISMLAITALVGTRDLGQEIYVSLTNANFGQGVVAGGGMAFIAIVADRYIQKWISGMRGLSPQMVSG